MAAKEQAEIRQHRDSACNGRHHRHDQSVAIAHVAQLVRHDASNFFLAQHGKKAARCRDGCIFGIAARGESVGMRAVDYIDLRHGQSCPACELLHQTVKFRSCPAVDLASMVHLEDNLRSEEHTSELQSLMRISYAVFCLNK